MGRSEPSNTLSPSTARKEARAKLARITANKTIPALLLSNPRARRGIQNAELIIDPPWNATQPDSTAVESTEHDTRGRKRKGDKGKSKHQRHDRAANHAESKSTGPPDRMEASANEQILPPKSDLRIRLIATDTLTAANLLSHEPQGTDAAPRTSHQHPCVGILDMASPLRPGGGFLRGASAQEEYLCMRTTLLPALKEEFYRLPEIGGVYVPDVLVFRGAPALDDEGEGKRGKGAADGDVGGVQEFSELGRKERFYVDVVVAGMLRFPEVEELVGDDEKPRTVYSDGKDLEVVKRKMRAVMRLFEGKGVDRVVLGAWGCGAYGNPVGEVSNAWKKVLLGEERRRKSTSGENWPGIKEVVFAIRDRRMAEDFAAYWGDSLVVGDEAGSKKLKDEARDGEGSGATKELEMKIEEIEKRMDLAKTPMLRGGLENVLKGLRGQLDQVQATAGLAEGMSEDEDEVSVEDSIESSS